MWNWWRKYLQRLKAPPAPSASAKEQEQNRATPVWGVAANVVLERPFGEQHEMRKGTKHFAPGAKVYCAGFHYNGDATRVQVVGRHRKSGRFIKVWMKPSHLANWRAELVYSSAVAARLEGWDAGEKSRQHAEELVNSWVAQNLGAGSQPFITREKHLGSDESGG